jgi:stage V sporulation protein AD
MNKEKNKLRGNQSISYNNPPTILSAASIAGKKEGEGPLGAYFDVVEPDPMFGQTSWEEAESKMLGMAVDTVIHKSGLQRDQIRYLIGGDLLGQLIATSFGIENFEIPLLGVYGACSTMGESIVIASMLVEGGFADHTLAITSSHFGGAEKQFRFPLAYGNQLPLASTWTVTGSGAVILGHTMQIDSAFAKEFSPVEVKVMGVTVGKIVDYGIKDSLNMGACMAPAACSTISQNLKDFNRQPDYYDRIITGDLGRVGRDILIDMLKDEGYDITANHMDCGIEIFDPEVQETHSGGSGCGCSAITLTGYILQRMKKRDWNRVLFVPTGALLSTVSYNEGQSVPGIAHAVILETN